MKPHSTIGGTQEPESHYMCVVYDRETGKIHHLHQVVNLPGAPAPLPGAMKASALHHAKRHGMPNFHVLVVPGDQIHRGRFYRVDHGKQALVAKDERGH